MKYHYLKFSPGASSKPAETREKTLIAGLNDEHT